MPQIAAGPEPSEPSPVREEGGSQTSLRRREEAGNEEALGPGFNEDTEELMKELIQNMFEEMFGELRREKNEEKQREMYQTISCVWKRIRPSYNPTEPFIAISQPAGKTDVWIALYSMWDKRVRRLPGIPQLQGRVPRACQGIALDGKLYILGGLKLPVSNLRSSATETNAINWTGSEEVYVLDWAGQGRLWKQCASMRAARFRFACCVLDRKIYVFGGLNRHEPVFEGEVYDPLLDSWSAISVGPPRWQRYDHHAVTRRGEFYLYGGSRCIAEYYLKPEAGDCRRVSHCVREVDYLTKEVDIYNPVTQPEWRKFDRLPQLYRNLDDSGERFALASTTTNGADHLGYAEFVNATSWTYRGSVVPPLPDFGLCHPFRPSLAVDDQIFAIADWQGKDGIVKLSLLECHGFGSGSAEEIQWKKVDCSLSFQEATDSPFMCLIGLHNVTYPLC